MNDMIGFIVAFAAIVISERANSPQDLSFGWQRAQLLGAFFNGVFLLALGISIFLQSIERFISIQPVEDPRLVMIVGCIGLALNIISAAFLHEHHGHGHGHEHGHGDAHDHEHTHDHSHEHGSGAMEAHGSTQGQVTLLEPIHAHAEHRHTVAKLTSPGRDLGMLGVLIHVIGDALNNIGVIIAAVVIWQTNYEARFYADPGASMGIAIMILLSALPLVKNSGLILLQSAPRGVDISDVKHDIEKIPGIESVHELHVWRLDQKKAIASAHVVVSDRNVSNFMEKAKTVSECLHAYGIHSATIQPELVARPPSEETASPTVSAASSLRRRALASPGCQMPCGKGLCDNLMCCT
ncbi:cation efflux protein [Thozetella sp. PMI_491]|nr:cation efflux protein [Thozetella sp. PMI_491]